MMIFKKIEKTIQDFLIDIGIKKKPVKKPTKKRPFSPKNTKRPTPARAEKKENIVVEKNTINKVVEKEPQENNIFDLDAPDLDEMLRMKNGIQGETEYADVQDILPEQEDNILNDLDLIDDLSVSNNERIENDEGQKSGKVLAFPFEQEIGAIEDEPEPHEEVKYKPEDLLPEQPRTAGKDMKPWATLGVNIKKIAPMIHAWAVERAIVRMKLSGWHVVWGTYDERWVPNIVITRKNILMGVYVHSIWNHKDFTIINESIVNRLLSWSLENDAIPIICNMGIEGTLKFSPTRLENIPATGLTIGLEDGYLFYDCIQRKPWSQLNYNPLIQKKLSRWEKNEMAVRITCNELEKDGFIIERWNPDPVNSPQIWAKLSGKSYHILVIPQLYMTEENIPRELIHNAMTYAIQEKSKLIAFKVTLASANSTLVSEVAEDIYRGEDVDFKLEEVNLHELTSSME